MEHDGQGGVLLPFTMCHIALVSLCMFVIYYHTPHGNRQDPLGHVQCSDLMPWRLCRKAADGGQELVIQLKGPEASDYLNFVIKDESTGTWYDQFGSNFKVALRLALTSQAFDEDDDVPAAVPDSELPELPTELCGIWSYIKWETAGCPQRNQEEADAEYQNAIQAGTLA